MRDNPVTFDIAFKIAKASRNDKKYEEAKMHYVAALEGQRRVLGDDHHDALFTICDIGFVYVLLHDNEGALSYYQQALMKQESIFGRNHPSTVYRCSHGGRILSAARLREGDGSV